MPDHPEGIARYDHKESFPSERPPGTDGLYGVLFGDGTPGEAQWSGGQWVTDKPVKRYSGMTVRVDRERYDEMLSRIVGGLNVPESAPQHLIARSAALALARHYARKYERADTLAKEKLALLNMCGFYKVAQKLGVSFDKERLIREQQRYAEHEATPTDVAHLEKYWNELEPDPRGRISEMTQGPANDWNVNEWAVARLRERLAKVD